MIKIIGFNKLIVIWSILIYVVFLVLFVLGLEIARVLYIRLFGQPYEIGWLLLYVIGKVTGLVLGIFGSIISSILIYIRVKRSYRLNKHSFLMAALCSHLLALIYILMTAFFIDKATPPCPNCVR